MNLQTRLEVYEGTKEYQQKLGYFRQGKFWTYKDSLGYPTIGYGHLVLAGEDFSNGLEPMDAGLLLAKDIEKAKAGVRTLGLTVPTDWEEFLVIMVFQLGLAGVKKFRKMIEALKQKDYPEAIKQAKDSLWYRQTPNRVNDMIKQLTNK